MTTYVYADAYLKSQVTDDRETRAIADVAAIATFSADWAQKLAILRAYILTCLECQAQPDDLFAQKLKHYRAEWDSVLTQAKAATTDTDGLPLPALTIPLERA
jgi:hypothetical protein